MAFRVDADGFRLDFDGTQLQTTAAEREKFKEEIERSWAAAGNTGEVPDDVIAMVVEDDDSQWKIAEDAGGDPVHTSYTLNGQFANPDLIHPDQVVFLQNINTHQSVGGGDNRDMFGDSVDLRAGKNDPHLVMDTTRYFASITDVEERKDVLQDQLSSAGSSAARQAMIQGYLVSLDSSENKAKELRRLYESPPYDNSPTTSSAIHDDIEAVMRRLEIPLT